MRYRRLGQSSLFVSELGLGTMTFGRETEHKTAIRMIHQFLDVGGNLIDTADVYADGRTEEIIGEAIKGRREEVILATKVGMNTGPHPNDRGYSRKRIIEGVEQSLRRLKTDYIDLYQLHVWDHLTPLEEAIRTLDDLVTSGKVRYIGCANFLGWQLMKGLSYSDWTDRVRFISIQPQYSLVSREMDREVRSLCLEEEVGILPWAPLAGGFLTGKYERSFEKPTFGRFDNNATGEYMWSRKATEHNFKILDEVERIATEIGKTPAQVALNWLINQPGITAPLFGARTPEQLSENLGSIGWQLEPSHFKALDEVSRLPDEYPNRFITKWRRDLIDDRLDV